MNARIIPLLDARVSLRRLFQLGILVLAIHNAEEALTAPGWLQAALPRIRDLFGVTPREQPSASQLYVALVLATVLPAVWVVLAMSGERKSVRVYSLMTLYSILFWNAWFPHIALALALVSYTPGVVTAVVLNVPFTLYLFRRAFRDGYVEKRGFAVAVVLGAVVYLPFLWGLHSLARSIYG